MPYTYEYPQIGVTVDIVLFALDSEEYVQKVLLIERINEPFKGSWALPGGYVEIDETCEEAAARELNEETGIANVALKMLAVFDDVNRHPKERVMSVAYINKDLIRRLIKPVPGDDAAKAEWFALDTLPELAFDHKKIIERAMLEL